MRVTEIVTESVIAVDLKHKISVILSVTAGLFTAVRNLYPKPTRSRVFRTRLRQLTTRVINGYAL
jgi:hypothetical protein